MNENNLERQIEPVLNPNGPNKQVTKDLIEALSKVPKSSLAYQNAQNLIEAVKKGYEIQSGEEYKP